MKQPSIAWAGQITDILFVYNPKASNYQRAAKLMDGIATRLNIEPQRFDVLQEDVALERAVQDLNRQDRVALVAIAGGDGTVSSVVNHLMRVLGERAATRLVVLPLWGGNANDMAYMLNGPSSAASATQIVTKTTPAAVPLIRIRLSEPAPGVAKGPGRTVYACCYASFGASAYAARQLDKRGYAKRKFIQYLPPVVAVRELTTVLKALVGAPSFRAKVGSIEAKYYEHTLVNGPRLAKVSRVPVELAEPQFFHAVVTKKDPSVIIELLRIVTRRHSPLYSTESRHSFMVHDRIDAQIDGEVYQLEPGTRVTATIVWPPFMWASSKITRVQKAATATK